MARKSSPAARKAAKPSKIEKTAEAPPRKRAKAKASGKSAGKTVGKSASKSVGKNGAPTPAAVEIRLYDFANLPFLPADPVVDPARDALHAPAYALIRDVLAFYESEFGRRSYDGAGRRVAMFVRYPSGGGYCDPDYEVLRFSGPWPFEGVGGRRFYFGDFSQSPDYVAHEFAHAVTNYCARLDYREPEQAGLHESLSDVFAVAFRNWRARRDDPSAPLEWRFGAGVALPPLSCTRNLAEPGDPRAWQRGFGHVADVTPDRNGRIDPYALAAIPSLAFRRVAQALGEDIMGAARLWYGALSDPRMVGVTRFGGFADLTVTHAATGGSALERAARAAWASVGVEASVTLAV